MPIRNFINVPVRGSAVDFSRFTERVKLYQAQTISDGAGGQITTWGLLGEFWAGVERRRARQLIEEGLEVEEELYVFNLRRGIISADMPTAQLRVEYRGETFRANAIIEQDWGVQIEATKAVE